jgi:hypothetical protein
MFGARSTAMKGKNEFRLCQAEMLEAMQQYLERTVMQKEYFLGAKVVGVRHDSAGAYDKTWIIEIEDKGIGGSNT